MVVTETNILHNLLVQKAFLEATEAGNVITIASNSSVDSLIFEEKSTVTISS